MSMLDFHLPESSQGVTTQPETYQGIQRGIHQLLKAIRPTLGPITRNVAVDKYTIHSVPELLDDGAAIARRVIQIKDPDANTGAMMMRGMLYRLSERVGDGTATAAVLYASIYDQCLKYILAGGNAMMLSRGLNTALAVVLEVLDAMVIPVNGKENLPGVARTVCHDDVLADELGNIFHTIGEFGLLETNVGRARENYHEFILGHYWPTNGIIADPNRESVNTRKEVENAGIFISDLEFQEAQDLVPVLRAALLAEMDTLVIMALEMSPSVQALIYQSQQSNKLRIIAVKPPYLNAEPMKDGMEDIAVLTGARIFHKTAGETGADVKPQDLGRVRRFWVDKTAFALVGGGGDPRTIREHTAKLRDGYYRAEKDSVRKQLKDRLGRLMGGAANFEVGGLTKPEMDTRRELVKRSEATLRAAVRSGLLPGGGTAYLTCRQALRDAIGRLDDMEEVTAYKILIKALEAPFRALMQNGGLNEEQILANIEAAGQPGYGYDLLSGQYGMMQELGVLDVAEVQQDALRTAVKSAALALTVDVILHVKDPVVMQNPE